MSSHRFMWLLLACVAVPAGVHADDRYQRYFQGAYRACSDQFPTDTVSASTDYAAAREDCYAKKVQAALAKLPPDSPRVLEGALQAAPDYAHVAFEAALQAGFDPYYAVTAATRTLPAFGDTFASRAIQYGADPSKVTEATAAGYKREDSREYEREYEREYQQQDPRKDDKKNP